MTLFTLLACTSSPRLVDPREPIRLSLPDSLVTDDSRRDAAEPTLEADGSGVRLGYGGSVLGVRTTAWGRGERTAALSPTRVEVGDRVELRSTGLTEWWAPAANGWEQGWTVAARPAGSGGLTLHVHVAAPARVTADQVDLGWGPTAWRVSGLRATDATGSEVPARFVTAAGGFAVAVNDRGAAYPLAIDPVYTTPNAELDTRQDTNSFVIVDGAGDVNGDGYDDVLVHSDDETDVFLSGPDGVSTTRSAIIYTGTSVAGAGDVNGDGYDDIVGGAAGSEDYGTAVVFYGSASGIPVAGTFLYGDEIGDYFGNTVDGAGDVNADGYDDIVIAGPSTFVYLGSADGITDVRSSVPESGYQVAGAGDLNGDGYDDIATTGGAVWVYYGSAAGVTADGGTRLSSLDGHSHVIVVAGTGDINSDGFDDLIGGNYSVGEDGEGALAVYFGGAGEVSDTPGVVINGDESRGGLGFAVASAGDLDGDGYDEVLATVGYHANAAGRVQIYAGTASGISCGHASLIDGSEEQEAFGNTVASAGDVNADGLDDIIVGTFGGSSRPDALVYLGRRGTDADTTGICDTGPFETDTGPPVDDSSADTGVSKSGCRGCASTGQSHPAALIALCVLILARRRCGGVPV